MTSCEETLSRVCTRGGRACEVAASKGGLDAVRKTLDNMRAAGFPPTVVSYNVAIRMLEPDAAFAVFEMLQKEADAYAEAAGDDESAPSDNDGTAGDEEGPSRAASARAAREAEAPRPDIYTYSSLINHCAKKRDGTRALEILEVCADRSRIERRSGSVARQERVGGSSPHDAGKLTRSVVDPPRGDGENGSVARQAGVGGVLTTTQSTHPLGGESSSR